MQTTRFTLPRPLWYSLGVVIVYCALFAGVKLVRPGSPTVFLALNDVIQLLGQVVMVPFCVYGLRRLWRQCHAAPANQRNLRWVPILLALCLIGESVGETIYAYYELVLHQGAPFPSWADVGIASVYPFQLLAILLLPTRPLSGGARMRILLDGVLIMTAMVTFSWYFLLGPTLLQGNETALAKGLGTGYMLCDLLLILCLVFLSFRSSEAALRPVVRLIIASLLIIVVTDSLYDYQTLNGLFQVGSWLELGWLVGYMLLGVAAQAVIVGKTQKRPQDTSPLPADAFDRVSGEIPPLWRSLLPYVCVPAVALLAVSVWRIGAAEDVLAPGVYLGGAVLIGLVLVRQIVATLETTSAAKRTQHLNTALGEANARLESLATTDPLTGLPNHRASITWLDQELKRSQRYARPCTLLFLDVDHFKALNDGYGHAVGDTVLCDFATAVRGFLRGTDTLGRWGGEEFVAILPETEGQGALVVAERVRAGVANQVFSAGSGLRLTCSVGIAAYPDDAPEREALLTAADRAMFGAKKLGRNQVRLISDPAILALETEAPDTREVTALAGTVEALVALVEARDHATGRQTHRVAELATRLALSLGLDASEASMIGVAGRLYDIGKVAIPDAILRKSAFLTEEEAIVVQSHASVGSEVVSWVPSLRALAPVIRAHHERWDGCGYSDQLVGARIPLGARILAVADAYILLIPDWPSHAVREEAEALAELQDGAGTRFDPQVVAALERVVIPEKNAVTLAGA